MREMQWYNTIIRPKRLSNAKYTINAASYHPAVTYAACFVTQSRAFSFARSCPAASPIRVSSDKSFLKRNLALCTFSF